MISKGYESLGARFVEIVVYAHSPLTIGFLDHYGVGSPRCIVHFSDETYFQQLFDFFLGGLTPFFPECSFFPSHWSCFLVNREAVCNDVGVYLGDIDNCPCEEINVIHQSSANYFAVIRVQGRTGVCVEKVEDLRLLPFVRRRAKDPGPRVRLYTPLLRLVKSSRSGVLFFPEIGCVAMLCKFAW